MLTLLFRKMRNTRKMILCLFIGFLMAAGMMSAVPIYMDSSLQRILIKDMQAYQTDTGLYPGEYTVSKSLTLKTPAEQRLKTAEDIASAAGARTAKTGLRTENSKLVLSDEFQYLLGGGKTTQTKVVAMTDIGEHITLLDGRMYNPGRAADGSFEVIANEKALKTLDVVCGGTYIMQNGFFSKTDPLSFTIVGVFEQKSETDSYWSETMDPYLNAVFMDPDTYKSDYMTTGVTTMNSVLYRCCFDYQNMDLNSLDDVTENIDEDRAFYLDAGWKFSMGVYDILTEYAVRAEKLKNMLWVLQIPTIVMLAFYLFMVSQLNVEQEKNEIAVLSSRGASSGQILGIYAMETGVLGLVTLIVSPFVGLMLTGFLGVSNGFLEFVNRTGLAAKLSVDAVVYALIAVVIFFFTTMLPIIPASKLTIVKYKQSKAKVVKLALWEKLCVDIILIGGSLVWYYFTAKKIGKLFADGTYTSDGSVNPMYFVFATMFILGAGLLFIRVYPYLLRVIYHVGKRLWSVPQYVAITSVARSQGGRERFLMMFLVMTLGLGIFSANTARAINNAKSDRIYYMTGADVVIDAFWRLESNDDESGFTELDFSQFEELSGVETATKVLKTNGKLLGGSKKKGEDITVMSIEPGKFAKTAWFRNDLLPIHWHNYCQALVECKSGALASRSLEEKGYQLGDKLSVKWGGNEAIELTIIAFVDYWPSIDPNGEYSENPDEAIPADFIVTNYNYIRKITETEPYQIWIKMADGATSEELYSDIRAKNIKVQRLQDSAQLLIAEKTDPELQGMNGALTLGFVVIMLMTVIGFLIYWIISIRSRTLQFGVLRAMGVTFKEIVLTLGYEQLLVSVASIAAGFVIGGMASDLFVPMFRTMYDAADQVPPFIVRGDAGDYIKLYVIIGLMLLCGFAVLGGIIRKININKALKLGED